MREVPHGEWDRTLEQLDVRDAYFQLDYVRACTRVETGEPLLLVDEQPEGAMAQVFIRRPIPQMPEATDLVTPYGYGGPVVRGSVDASSAGGRFVQWCETQKIVSVFYRSHPLLRTHEHLPPQTHVVPLVGTIGWRTTPGTDLEAAMHQRHRRSVRKARREGVVVTIEQEPADFAWFVELYETTMRRQQATDFYFFDEEYWSRLGAAPRVGLTLVRATLEDEPIAGLMCFATPPFLHYHLGATADVARNIGASNLCFLEAATWAQQQGYERFHLGGGVGGARDSLFEFKQRFDPDPAAELNAVVGKLVTDPVAYRELAGTDSIEGFFPAYRS
jgi:serine/alanine adding enzyme